MILLMIFYPRQLKYDGGVSKVQVGQEQMDQEYGAELLVTE